jgi:5'-nucleotidase
VTFRRGARPQGPDADTDVIAAGRIAVTPIRYDRTDEAAFAVLAGALPRL